MEVTAAAAQIPDEDRRFPPSLYNALTAAAEAARDAELQQRASERRRALYRIERVGADRFAFAELTQLLEARQQKESGSVLAAFLPEANEIEEALARLESERGNTTYEAVHGIGFGPDEETVAAVVTVRKRTGYATTLAASGSKELVAFWLELHGAWHYLGTSSLPVHDREEAPVEGEQYLVIRPVPAELLPTGGKPIVGTLRAVLSWNTPPSATDPHAVPYWGNRDESRVSVRPRKRERTAVHAGTPRVFRVEMPAPGAREGNTLWGQASGERAPRPATRT
jgi:hypothetical protein